MIASKLEQISLATTLAMVEGIKQHAQECYAATYTDGEVSDILASHGGNMITALAHLERLAVCPGPQGAYQQK